MTKPEKKIAAGLKINEAPTPAVKPANTCVVDDGRCVGRAVNGKVCSYHAMRYDALGRRRK